MAEEKKPKIDLKARLGKAQAGGAQAAVPAPSGVPAPGVPATPSPDGQRPSGVPAPVVSPSAIPAPGGIPVPVVGGSGVPVPPFAQPSSQPKRGPVVDANDPFGSVAASEAPRQAPQAIKIEIGEDVVAAQQKANKKSLVIAGLVGVVGLGLGFVWGGQKAQSDSAKVTIMGAADLAGDVEKAQAKVKELNDKIGAAIKDLQAKKFPETFAADLGGLSIPFGADKLAGKNIGRFPPQVLQTLFDYTSDVDALNDRKDALKNLFIGQKQAINDALASAGNPKVTFNVFVQKSPAHGPIAILAAVNPKDAWPYKDANWPAKYKISTGRELVDVERYMSGEVFSGDKKVVTLPIDPDSIISSFPNDVIVRITSELAKTGTLLAGKTGTPDEDDAGVIKKGDSLVAQLKKIGGK